MTHVEMLQMFIADTFVVSELQALSVFAEWADMTED